jgi:hypothetical protein
MHANGDKRNGVSSASVPKGPDVLDFRTAVDRLDQDFSERDGISVRDLLDSRLNGGLTYNDFLVLPGYIGTAYHPAQLAGAGR